ncbi:MAG: hypothetical protein CML20_22935 [Rheinheimera sp.]|nr:hypothetical protein [Rheinheimera sp.]|tara:strand:- start:17193 stop:18023 length:831 start_codon:yes stop_codon:yes gene_type:complete
MPTTSLTLIPSDAVFAQNDSLVTTSIKVAEAFGKQHRNVTAKIKSLDCSDDFLTANFLAVKYEHKGNQYDLWNITKDGFMFLVMGFTGKKAAAIKEAYIRAFNDMAAKLYPVLSNQTLTPSQQSEIRQLIAKIAKQFQQPEQHATYSKLYGRLKSHFKVAKYDQIPYREFENALGYIQHLAHELNNTNVEIVSLPKTPLSPVEVIPVRYNSDSVVSPLGNLINQLMEAERQGLAVKVENIDSAGRDYTALVNLIRQQNGIINQIKLLSASDVYVNV